MRRIAPLPVISCVLLALATPGASGAGALTAAETPRPSQTLVLDQQGLERLLHLQGLTLQWISWDTRGTVEAYAGDEYLHLSGVQRQADGPGLLELDGRVSEIGANYFVFEGTIRISDTPDPGRACEATKIWHFAITQNRKYYRLREFEWCDELTDYIDLYF